MLDPHKRSFCVANRLIGFLLSDERPNLCPCFCQFFVGDSALPHGFSRAPVKALDLVSKNDILRHSGDQNLKRKIFDLRRERTTD
jgi:hypothetical protein